MLQEWFFALAVAININALLLPLLYVAGELAIRISSWMARRDLELRRDAMR